MKILSTSGMLVIGSVTFAAKTIRDNISTLERLINDSWTNSIYSQVEFDGILKRLGIVYEVNNELTGKLSYEQLHLEIGTPLEIFEGYYKPIPGEINIPISQGKNDPNFIGNLQRITTILSGLSFPEGRLKSALDIVEKTKNNVPGEKKYNVLESDLSWLNNMRRETLTNPSKKNNLFNSNSSTSVVEEDFDIDFDELFEKYN